MADKVKFFEEAPGVKSWTRLAATWLILWATCSSFYCMAKGIAMDYTLIFFLVGTAVAGKVIQKPMEPKQEVKEVEDKIEVKP